MGLFNKLKNVLFEVEEVEIPVEEPKKVHKPEIKEKQPVKMTFNSEEEPEQPVSDRELFKAEKTFDFPVFDDKEFDTMKEIETKPEEPKSMSINLFDYEKPKNKEFNKREKKSEEIKGRAYTKPRPDIQQNLKFKPSPVISPVYGVLDKNYKKEDIVIEKEIKKSVDVDDVRKKAFGNLEEEEDKKSIDNQLKDFYEEEKIEKVQKHEKKEDKIEKSIEDLLEETAFDTIELPEEEEVKEEIELDIPKPKTKEEKIVDDDTIENDLFDLIDSMYENREDE